MHYSASYPKLTTLLLLMTTFVLCVGFQSKPQSKAEIKQEAFGQLPDGTPVEIFTLTNHNGVEARITNYGGILVSLKTPDRNGQLGDVVLGYDTLAAYVKRNPMFGALVGRYAGRIAKAKFTLNGVEYQLARNSGENHIHGGPKGFDKQVWQAKPVTRKDGVALVLSYLSKDGEEGYPGNLAVTLTYTLTKDNALRLDYSATTDKDTVLNLTNHSYFNLAGAGDVLRHEIMIDADRFTVGDDKLIPTGEVRLVNGTPLDFRQMTAIGARINAPYDQITMARGYDHNYVLKHKPGLLGLAAKVQEPTTGRVMEVLTTEPGVVFYTSNGFNGSLVGKSGQAYVRHAGFCLETQHFPDSPNHPEFPSTVLKKGAKYQATTVFKFSAK